MRERSEIEKAVENNDKAWASDDLRLILEVLLDIRDLQKKTLDLIDRK